MDGVNKRIVAGLPHSGTSIVAGHYQTAKTRPADPIPSRPFGYSNYESSALEVINHILDYAKSNRYNDYGLMNSLHNEAKIALNYTLDSKSYCWKTTGLQQHASFWFNVLNNSDYFPDEVLIIIRDVNNYISSITDKYPYKDEYTIVTELEAGFSLLKILTKQYNYKVILIEDFIKISPKGFKSSMLSRDLPKLSIIDKIDLTNYYFLYDLKTDVSGL